MRVMDYSVPCCRGMGLTHRSYAECCIGWLCVFCTSFQVLPTELWFGLDMHYNLCVASALGVLYMNQEGIIQLRPRNCCVVILVRTISLYS